MQVNNDCSWKVPRECSTQKSKVSISEFMELNKMEKGENEVKKSKDKPFDSKEDIQYRSVDVLQAQRLDTKIGFESHLFAEMEIPKMDGKMNIQKMDGKMNIQKMDGKMNIQKMDDKISLPKVEFVDKTNYAMASAMELPSEPYPLEKSTHFYVKQETKSTLQRICIIIGQLLGKYGADFEFTSEKCKWKVAANGVGGKMYGVVRVYSIKDKGLYVVEFQRRSGDLLLFLEYYRKLYTSFQRNQMVYSNEGKLMLGTNLEDSGKKDACWDTTATKPKNMVKVIQPLLCMLENSPKVDTQLQALVAMQSISKNNTCLQALNVVVPHVLQMLCKQHQKDQVVIPISNLLVVLMQNEKAQKSLVYHHEALAIILSFAANSEHHQTMTALELQRNSLQIVALLCPSHAKYISTVDIPQVGQVQRTLFQTEENQFHFRMLKYIQHTRNAFVTSMNPST